VKTSDLVQALVGHGDQPVYATTPHGTYLFTIERVSTDVVETEGEDRVVLHLREASR